MSSQDVSLTPTQPAASQFKVLPPVDASIHARLVSIAGPQLTYEMDVKCEQVMIGRHQECQIIVEDKTVSAKHLRIYRDGRRYFAEQLSSNASFINESCLHKGHRRALQHGDELSIVVAARETRSAPFAAYIFQVASQNGCYPTADHAEMKGVTRLPLEASRKVVSEQWVRDNWDMRNVLGSGGFSEVRLGARVDAGAAQYAVKVIDKAKFQSYQRRRKSELNLQSEVDTLTGLKHPGVVRFHEWFETETQLYVVMEFLGGGDLLDFIMNNGCFSEGAARRLFHQLCSAVGYLHSCDVVHRDLKPENIMLSERSEIANVKIVDFGLAKNAPKSRDCRTFCGTPQYFAPEVISTFRDRESGQLDSGYGKQVDMWSLGVILYIMLSGVPPFEEDDEEAGGGGGSLYRQILEGRFEFDVPEWNAVSADAKELVQKLLTVNPRDRLTVQQALEHPWLKQHGLTLTPPPKNNEASKSLVFSAPEAKRRRTME